MVEDDEDDEIRDDEIGDDVVVKATTRDFAAMETVVQAGPSMQTKSKRQLRKK